MERRMPLSPLQVLEQQLPIQVAVYLSYERAAVNVYLPEAIRDAARDNAKAWRENDKIFTPDHEKQLVEFQNAAKAIFTPPHEVNEYDFNQPA